MDATAAERTAERELLALKGHYTLTQGEAL